MLKKLNSLIVVIVITFSLIGLASCSQKDELDLTTWNEALEERIRHDYFQQFGHESSWIVFYGMHNNGSVALFFPTGNLAIKNVVISGVEFRHTTWWRILIWRSGSFYDLEDIDKIFDNNILTQSDIEEIGRIHSETNASNR
ncbi:MAG: hypothetical protein FWE36_04300 [Erysipelotrichales bacterium]|nr:hypothetical protein [Erysipelotrichales bacterium]